MPCLPAMARTSHVVSMFAVTEADAAAIQAVIHEDGELSAAIEVRRRFPGITENANSRGNARGFAGWTPRDAAPCTVTRLRPGRKR